MKKSLLVMCLVVALLSAASAAMASSSFWTVYFQTGFFDGGSIYGSTNVDVGAITGTLGDPSPDPVSTNANIAVKVAGPAWWGEELRNSSSSPIPQTYTLTLAIGDEYASSFTLPGEHYGQVYFTAWSPDMYRGGSGRSILPGWRVIVQNQSRTQTYANWGYNDLYGGNPPFFGPGRVGFWFTPSSTATTWDSPNNDTFLVTVVTPEPSGLIGIAGSLLAFTGLALRRRRGG